MFLLGTFLIWEAIHSTPQISILTLPAWVFSLREWHHKYSSKQDLWGSSPHSRRPWLCLLWSLALWWYHVFTWYLCGHVMYLCGHVMCLWWWYDIRCISTVVRRLEKVFMTTGKPKSESRHTCDLYLVCWSAETTAAKCLAEVPHSLLKTSYIGKYYGTISANLGPAQTPSRTPSSHGTSIQKAKLCNTLLPTASQSGYGRLAPGGRRLLQ